jgi:hypothetical protein
MKIAGYALAVLLLAAPAGADSTLARACKAGPAGYTRAQCLCLDKELTKALSPKEIKIETVFFEGKLRVWQEYLDEMGPLKTQDFQNRLAKAVAACKL